MVRFINYARAYLQGNKAETKYRYALERMDKRLAPVCESYTEALTDLQIEHAATDEKGALLTEGETKSFRYTKDGLRARNKAQKELLEKPVEFEPYYATELPENLSEAEKEICAGFVMEEPEEAKAES